MKFSIEYLKQNIQGLEDKFFGRFKEEIIPLQRLIAFYKCALMEVETKFNVLNEELSLAHERNPIETIKTRVKSWTSIRQKIRQRQLPMNIKSIEKELNDIAGIRIICPFIDDIFLLADYFIGQDDITLIEKKDYITNPKENGYRGLHLIIGIPIFLHDEKKQMKVEVQLRTIAMDFWASLEHRLKYKKDLPAQTIDKISVQLKQCADTSSELDLKMKDIRDGIERNSNEQK